MQSNITYFVCVIFVLFDNTKFWIRISKFMLLFVECGLPSTPAYSIFGSSCLLWGYIYPSSQGSIRVLLGWKCLKITFPHCSSVYCQSSFWLLLSLTYCHPRTWFGMQHQTASGNTVSNMSTHVKLLDCNIQISGEWESGKCGCSFSDVKVTRRQDGSMPVWPVCIGNQPHVWIEHLHSCSYHSQVFESIFALWERASSHHSPRIQF